MFNEKKAIFFDFDGTLIDSAQDLAFALNETLKHFSLPTYELAIIRNWIGNGAHTLLLRGIYGKKNVQNTPLLPYFEEALSYFLNTYKNNATQNTTLYPNVKQTLQILYDRGYILTIITNKPSQFIAPILQKFQMQHLFSNIIGGDDLSKKKPDPLPLLTMLQRLHLSPQDAVMVGDSANDIIAAQSAHIDSIAVTYGYADKKLHSLGATLYIDDFNELLRVFP
jgi:phosphoglycolate phosphatase